ncbi:DUF1273 domain-containing protein [Fictibacillus norfolkensis]|uniref:UPF0398 protein H9648_07875 n=1 Tax=Fictibacillus norfolkensis TaxID=2762233 RepID=A0ABR8SKG7_9BACL|nr:DUF1273 domain-containing protein [Fictibacillus norfolkensis]MBD7963969.1 DUF1273 domain-containing protein [Fictibacillus norfolkensis]
MLQTLLVSGYKAHELGIFSDKHEGVYYIKKAIAQKLVSLLDEGLEWVIISGQPGVEMWAAEVVFELQTEFSDLKLAVLTPFLEQESRWKENVQEKYHEILAGADFVDSVSRKPYESPGQLRVKNQFLVQKSDAVLLLYDEEKDGSPKYYLDAAKQKQEMDNSYEIFYITPYDLDVLVQEEQYNRNE